MAEYRNFKKELIDLKYDFNFVFDKIIEKIDELENIQKASHALIEENRSDLLFQLHTKEKQIQ